MNRRIKGLFLLSLLLNLLLIGLVLGQMSPPRFSPHRPPHGPMAERLETLPPELRERFGQAMERARADNRPLFAQMREAREKTLELLRAETFDENAYQQQAEKIHALRGRMKQRFAEAVKELARDLPQSDRAALAEILRRPPPPPPPGE